MKKTILSFGFLILTTLSKSKHPIYIHDKLVKHKDSTFLKLKDYQPKHIDVAYTPQRVVRVQKTAKKLPLQRYVYNRGMQYLKYIARGEKASKTSNKTVELIARSEQLGKQMYSLLGDKCTLSSNDIVVRLYRKIDDSQSKKFLWKPIMTVPLESFKEHVEANISVSPKGNLLLQNS